MAMPDEWTEIAYVAISDSTGLQYQFGALTDTIDISWGTRDIEAIATVAAGRVVKFIPDDLSEVTLELYPVGISSNGTIPNGIHAWFVGLAPTVTSGINTYLRKKFRVVILWTDKAKALVIDAAGAITAASSFRVSFWNCYMTSGNIDFTDDIVKVTAVFKCPPFAKDGDGLIKIEEEDAGDLATLGAYAGIAPA